VNPRFVCIICAVLWIAKSAIAESSIAVLAHPRLYFSTNEIASLRVSRFHGTRKTIWNNLAQSADWCLAREVRQHWIAPVSPDPRYENLYDRFYAIMSDLAITEHLAFAYALSGDARYGEATRQWVLASCRTWQHEAESSPDSGKAYAVSRLLKGVAVGYDAAFDRFSEAERGEIRETIIRISKKYFDEWFNTPAISGGGYHTHHAVVEWGSFGVVALALLGEEPQAKEWVEATVRKFEEHLLPNGLAPDGAQTEGTTFWASTMHYRLFFMEALRNVTGKNLFQPFANQMNADLALASVACRKSPGLDEHHANVILEPSYGQLDYYAPILLALAAEYRRPIFQELARWDQSLGSIQHTRYVTPHGEELLFELGGYAYIWCDDSLRASSNEKKLSWHFPSTDEAYARLSWKPGELLVGLRKGELVVHAGGQTVIIESGMATNSPVENQVLGLTDDGSRAVIRSRSGSAASMEIELDRKHRKLLIRRAGSDNWRFWCQGEPEPRGGKLKWKNGTTLTIRQGRLTDWSSQGYTTALSVGNGLLPLKDPRQRSYPLAAVAPERDGNISVEIH
jgi:hypothetical protein